jgi:hypothetical protein
MKADVALRRLKELDSKAFEVGDTYISCNIVISLYMPYQKVETLLVFEEGCYNEVFEVLAEMEEE